MYTLKNKEVGTGYNDGIRGEYENDYEFKRWFIRSRNRAEYAMTYKAIKSALSDVNFDNCLEVGPGPGTWTRVVYKKNPKAQFHLVDISEAMKEQFELEMRILPTVQYEIGDIMDLNTTKEYDLFFSSRAVEYFDDKPAFFSKLTSLIKFGGHGVIVTKNPYHGIRKDKGVAHQGQIAMTDMSKHLSENGFSDIKFYATVRRIPIISRFTSELAEYLFEKGIDTELDIQKQNKTVESYTVVFSK
ncbi:methyltransferase domain-containing protein [Candidatus Kaiserbacteria bacterium]|nr:methyltransferase domain-containing protein [Candidatus Kaiserbacteria bacterium]